MNSGGIGIDSVKKFIDFQRDLHGHSWSVIIDGTSAFPHSDFFGKSEWRRDKVTRPVLTRCFGSTEKQPDGVKPYERNRVYLLRITWYSASADRIAPLLGTGLLRCRSWVL